MCACSDISSYFMTLLKGKKCYVREGSFHGPYNTVFLKGGVWMFWHMCTYLIYSSVKILPVFNYAMQFILWYLQEQDTSWFNSCVFILDSKNVMSGSIHFLNLITLFCLQGRSYVMIYTRTTNKNVCRCPDNFQEVVYLTPRVTNTVYTCNAT